ncbi:hypothetical protein IB267_27040 [Ensifer sp. ENS09]|uniref:hypothetical protein n=1 Tax=Ensifer sp. ENS09 TaxID=2769263 RepID=UPI0017860EAF|nr:hypothetical protein [Ensifer sp. ENS09]MBD9652021.1 hypothetical protein [Ensifer sp. ENS09]
MQNQLGTTPEAITHSMADAMRMTGDGCTERDLLLRGFTRQEILRHGDAAREMALASSSSSIRARVHARRAA